MPRLAAPSVWEVSEGNTINGELLTLAKSANLHPPEYQDLLSRDSVTVSYSKHYRIRDHSGRCISAVTHFTRQWYNGPIVSSLIGSGE